MLERVTLGQTRFAMPGIAPDSRGIVLGKLGALLFPSLDGVVRWLRLYADEDSLDDLLPTTRLLRVVTPLKSRACLLLVPAASTYVLDRAARCAKLAGGATFTGTTRHFVKYRDEKSPHGYDAADLGAPAPGIEVVLHGEEAALSYGVASELDVPGLILRLSPVRVPGAERLDAEGRAQLFLSVAGGLAAGLLRYLLRAGVRSELTSLSYEKRSAFAAPGDPLAALLMRVHDLPERLLGTLRAVPGVTVFRPASDNLAVEVGYKHPVALTSVSSIFNRERFYLFHGAADRLDVINGPLVFSSSDNLGELRVRPTGPDSEQEGRVAQAGAAAGALDLGVAIQLVPTLAPPRRVVGTLVSWSEADRLKKLVYTLPPVLLRGHQMAATTRGMLLVASEGVDVVPLGTLLIEAAPGLLIPLGMDLLPRVPVDVLQAAIEHHVGESESTGAGAATTARITVFPHDGGPFFVSTRDLAPLERRVVARIPVPPAPAPRDLYSVPDPRPGEIVNDAVGRFALWGFENPPPRKP